MVKKLIRCVACNQVIPNYEGSHLVRAESLPGVEWSSADLDGAREFLRIHLGHPLEELTVEEGSHISDRPSYEPVRVTHFLAGNGQREFLIRRTRRALDEPASYEVVPGKLELSGPTLEIQEDVLRRQIAAEKRFSPLLKGRMQRFIGIFRDEITRVSPETFGEEAGEMIEDAENPTVTYAALKDSHWERILNRCRLYFDQMELEALRRFIDDNRHLPDGLFVRMERCPSVVSPAQAGAISLADMAMERKKIEAGIEDQASAEVEKKAAKGKL